MFKTEEDRRFFVTDLPFVEVFELVQECEHHCQTTTGTLLEVCGKKIPVPLLNVVLEIHRSEEQVWRTRLAALCLLKQPPGDN